MRWSRFWQRQRRDADLARELAAYLEQETAEQITAGRDPDEALHAARRKLGNATRIREDVYERNSLVALETFRQDLSYAWRLLRRNPAFAMVAILSVALGIGANTAVFTLLDQVALRTLPVPNADRLVLLTPAGYQYGNAWGDGVLSYPMFEDLRDSTLEQRRQGVAGDAVLTGMFARFNAQLDVSAGGSSERVSAEYVSGLYFSLLGVPAALGRVLDRSDDTTPRGHPVIVLSHRYWRDRFGSDRNVIGLSLRVNRQALTIVGVAREGFNGTDLVSAADVFVPIMMAEAVGQIDATRRNRRMRWLTVFGLLSPAGSPEQARAALQPFYRSRLAFEVQEDAFARASSSDKTRFLDGSLEVASAPYGKSNARSLLTRPLQLLTVIGVIVLIIACANVANLLLARASVRRREIAVRLALGATRRRIVRQLLVESVLLAFAGGLAGLVLATWGAQALLGFLVERDPTLAISAWPDQRILAVNVLVSVAAGVLFGLAPAWQSTRSTATPSRRCSRPDVSPAFKADSAALSGGGHARLRRGLVVTQVMLSLLLLVTAGLFLRSLQNLLAADAGFDAERLLTFSIAPASHGYEPARTRTFARTLLERVRATPGVSGAGFLSNALLEGDGWDNRMTIQGRQYDPNARIVTSNNHISPGYFSAMGIRLIAGRDFDWRDERDTEPGVQPEPPRVAIANEQFVKEFLDGRNPLGVHVGFGRDPGTPTPTEIVGVVTTAKYTSMRSQPTAQLYFPYFEAPAINALTMYVRTSREPAALTESMRRVLRDIDSTLPIHDVRTVEEQINRSLVLDRMVASLSSVLAVLAVLLAMVGLYGVMSYTVARRTREIAIRMALGAVYSKVASLVVRDMLVLVLGGVLLALPAVWALTRVFQNVLYDVPPGDPTTIASALGVLFLGAAVAVWVPSRRALRVDPTAALRDE